MQMDFDEKLLPFFRPQLKEEIKKFGIIQEFEKGTEILREQQHIKMLPIMLKGLVKVYSKFEERELLLYYIEPGQSCVMTFYGALKNTPSKVYASIEEKSTLLLLPVQYLPDWVKTYPDFNDLFYELYNLRYVELLDTIEHLLVFKLDKRLYDYLVKKSSLSKSKIIKMSHIKMADELGTSREVITRMLKKLELEDKIIQNKEGIKIM
jgi:CRP/FNR family transcriptional regulator, anaerobic regulatory protein